MINQNSKTAFIVVLYQTPKNDIEKLKKEIKNLKFKNHKLYFIDNTKDNRGYAGGVNSGIKKALIDNCELLIVANPDISLQRLTGDEVLKGGEYFDLWGFAMRQDGKMYYGGEIDKWRMSGGLIRVKPRKRFVKTEWISGSLIFIKRKVVETIGYFAEDFFMYYEDVDFCIRAKKTGYRIGIDSQLVYDHFEASKTNRQKKIWLEKSRIHFLLKHGGWMEKFYELVRLPKTIYEYIS